MRRREFIGAAGAATMFALTARTYAQGNGRTPRIALVATASRIEELTINGFSLHKGYFSELERLGYIEGKNLLIERYSALGRIDRFKDIAQTVVERAPDLIITWNNALALQLKTLTTTIPILVGGSDPITSGLITNLARPGANVTGVSGDAGLEIWGKRLQILVDAVPTVKNARFLVTDETTRQVKNVLPILSQTARQLNISIHAAVVGNAPDLPAYERVFQLMAAERVDGIVMIDSPEHFVNRASIVRFAAQYRMPTVYAFREFVQAGGLLSYGIDLAETGRRLAGMTVDIVSGKKPAEIPFYQHVKFQLSLNRATERTLGLEFPASVLATADEVIE